ncbi:MAG: hypothetical protein KC620_07995, partial [Myxococcales bacterium]|nr:hypothetical protein [Myxococcales bacterium]
MEKTEGLGAVLDVLEQFVPLLALGPGFTEAFVGDLAGRLEAIEAAPGPAPQGFAEICDRAASTVERLGHAVPAQRIRALGAIARREVAEAGRPAEAPTAPLEDDIGWIDAVANARGAVASLAQWQGFDTSAARRERAELAVQCLADTAQALRDNPQPARTVGLANLVLDVLRLAQANTCPDLVPRIAHTVRDFVPPDEDPPARLERARRLLDGGETDQATRLLLWDLAASLSTPQGRALLARATGGSEDTRAAGVRIWQAHAANAAGDFEAMGRALTDAIRLLDDAPPGPRRTELMRVAHNIDRWVLARRAQASGGSGPQFSWAVACHDRQRGASWLARLNRGQAALAAAKAALALGHHDTGVRWAERARSAVDGLVPARQEAGYRGAFLRACVDTRFEADLTRGQALLDMGQVAQARALAQGLLTDVGQLPSTDPAMRLQATRMFLANCRA